MKISSIQTSWQNGEASLKRRIEWFIILGIYHQEELVGYGVIEPKTGDLPQLAIKKEYRRQGLANILLRYLIQYTEKDSIRIINVKADYHPFKKFGESLNLKSLARQYEMVLPL